MNKLLKCVTSVACIAADQLLLGEGDGFACLYARSELNDSCRGEGPAAYNTFNGSERKVTDQKKRSLPAALSLVLYGLHASVVTPIDL